AFRIRQHRQEPFLSRYRQFRAPPAVLENIRFLVLDIVSSHQGRHAFQGRVMESFDIAYAHARRVVATAALFPALERIEVDVNLDFLRNLERIDGQPAANTAAALVLRRGNLYTRWFYDTLIDELMWAGWAQRGRRVTPEVVVRAWNEDNADEWVRRQREGTLRPAVTVVAADYAYLFGTGQLVISRAGLTAELMFLPHVAAVLRRRGGEAMLLS
ncbi:hypothetical protein LTR95_016503, partial [Oleoguttula sp. CCFEE 5521]